jgi:hypothetical protein
MGSMLNGSSTMHSCAGSRRGSSHQRQGSTAVMELQREQWKRRALTSTMARASASASAAVTLSRWWARPRRRLRTDAGEPRQLAY